MTTAELKEYLGMVVQVEKEVDTQERLRQKLSCAENEYDEKIANITKVMGKIRELIRKKIRRKPKIEYVQA